MDSIAALVMSQLDASLTRLLGGQQPGSAGAPP
jgi:hypothetical protein